MWYRGRFALMADGRIMKWGHENTANHKQDKKNGSKSEIFRGKNVSLHTELSKTKKYHS